MAIDASIYGAIRAPQMPNQLEQFAQVQQIQGAQNQNRLADLMYSEKQRESAGDNELARLLASGKGPQEVATGLAGAGYGRQSMAYTKAQQEAEKTKGEIGKTAADVKKTGFEIANLALTQQRDMLNTVNDPASAKQWLTAAYQNPDTKAIFERMGPLDVALDRFDKGVTTPEAFAKWKQQASLNAQELVKYTTPDANATLSAKTSRENNDATNATSRANNAASNATTQRGQNMADGRAREANNNAKAPAGYRWNKDGSSLEPIPGGPAGKTAATTEGERKAATLLKRLEGSQAQLSTALGEDAGAAKPGLIASGLRAAGQEILANGATPQARQRVEAAQLDILDAALTLGTGAAYTKEQLEGYRKSYFPQINDDKKTIADKQVRLRNVIDAAKIAAGRAGPQSGGATGDFSQPTQAAPNIDALLDKYK